MTMKKQGLSITTHLFCLVALFLLFSSFTYLANYTAEVATKQSFWTTLQGFSFEKLGFWQKMALALGMSSGVYVFFRRRFRRHYGEGVGCLGVLGILVLGAIVIALLPLLIVVGVVMLILGIPFPHSRGRRYRRRW